MGIMKRFAPEKALACKHDWEEVDSYSWTEIFNDMVTKDYTTHDANWGYNYLEFTYRDFNYFGRKPEFMRTEMPKQRVCLLCGKCDNQVKEARAKIMKWLNAWADSKQERIDRKKLAKKMWSERGCDHVD